MINNLTEKKVPKWKEERIDARRFNAQSRMFAGDLPDRMVKNGKELDFLTVKGNDLPMIERIQIGSLFEGENGYVWRANERSKQRRSTKELNILYMFKKVGKYNIEILYRSRRNQLDLFFNSESRRDDYFNELINGRKILKRN